MMVREKTPYSKVSVFLENEKSNRNTGGSLVPLWEYDFKYECENHGKNANKFWNLDKAYFNNYRYIKTQDDWSRSLELLKNWETKWKYKCWGKEYSIDWRKEDFNKYINYFYLWDFVSDTNGEKSKDDLNEFNKSLDSCIKTIKRRGAFMTLMLMIQEEIGDKKFCKLRKEVFVQKEEVYKDYNSVMIEIRNNLPGVDEILNESLEACNLCEIKVL